MDTTRKLKEPIDDKGVKYHSFCVTAYPNGSTAIVLIGKVKKKEVKELVSVNIPRQIYKLEGEGTLFFLKTWAEGACLASELIRLGHVVLLGQTANTGSNKAPVAKIA